MVSSIGNNDNFTNYLLMAGAMTVDAETGEGTTVGQDGAVTKVAPEVVAEMLAAAGLMLQNGKIVGLDKVEKSLDSANAQLSIGSKPPLPAMTSTSSPSEVKSSVAMLEVAQSIQDNALLMNAILLLMRGAEDDRLANDQLSNTMFKMKDMAKQGQIAAGHNKVKYDLEAAHEQYRNAMIMAGVQALASVASAATAGVGTMAAGIVNLSTAVISATAGIVTAELNKQSAKEGAQHESGTQDKNASLYKIVEENCQAVIDIAKESSDASKDMWKNALKLISAMEQRATQNVQAFTRI